MTSPATVPYHVGQQNAKSLLQPIAIAIGELEARLAHYQTRVRLGEDDRPVIAAAHAALARAHADITTLIKA